MVLLQLHGKCCYMSFSCNPDKSDLILKDSTTVPSAEEYVILGVMIDNRLTFYNHLKNYFLIQVSLNFLKWLMKAQYTLGI